MEYAKDGFMQIKYNSKLNKIELKKENWTSKVYKTIKKHKLITTVIIAFGMFSTLNAIMIYNFMKIMQNIWKKIKVDV